MKTYHKIFLLILFSVFSSVAFGQANDVAKKLVADGVALHDAGKYDEAIAKYKEAMKIDPNYSSAYHEISFTLFSSGKGMEAIPYLEQLLKLDPKSGAAYDMLGSIYDDDKQADKAIEYYKKGIEVAPDYQRLHFNLAISSLRQKKYPEAEAYAVEAIKLDPKHASSHRAYAMATFYENKRGVSLLAWSSFLLLEPQTKRSAEAFNYVKYILNYGISKKNEKTVNVNISATDLNPGNLSLPLAILSATTDKKGLTAIDSLTLQLQSVYKVSHTFSIDKKDDFYTHFYADYFDKLAQTDNMQALARLISLSAYRDETLQWFKDNNAKLSALDAWVTATKREF